MTRGSATASAIPPTPAVLVTAHGISDRERPRLESAGKRLIDTTCPLVRRVQRGAQALAKRAFTCSSSDAETTSRSAASSRICTSFDVSESPDDVRALAGRQARHRLSDDRSAGAGRRQSGPRSRSANPRQPRSASSTRSASRRATGRRPSIGCCARSTRWSSSAERTRTTRGNWSNAAAATGVPVWHVQAAADLDRRMVPRASGVVGLTAGTSTTRRHDRRGVSRPVPIAGRRSHGPRGQWLNHFRRNAANPCRDSLGRSAPAHRCRTSAPSLDRSRIFQLGESGGGTRLLRRAKRHAPTRGDPLISRPAAVRAGGAAARRALGHDFWNRKGFRGSAANGATDSFAG